MDVTIRSGDVEMTLEVEDKKEAVALFAEIARLNAASNGAPIAATQKDSEAKETVAANATVSEDSIRKALLQMKGKASGQILLAISRHAEGCSDATLKSELATEGDKPLNVGPSMAHLAKCCNKAGVSKAAILVRRSQRGPKGKMKYFNRVTDVAARLIEEIGDFDRDPVFVDVDLDLESIDL